MSGTALLAMRADEVRNRTADGLRERRVEVGIADSINDALEAGRVLCPDVIVVDLALADDRAGELCMRIRGAEPLALIALGDGRGEDGPVEALQAGADDYLAYPQSPIELVARVRALIRRLREYSAASSALIARGEVVVDCERHEVTVRGEPVSLTPKEFDLLRELASSAGELVPRDELLRDIWGLERPIASRTLDVHIGRLRKKIERDPSRPRLIVTVPRLGYRLAA